MKYSILRRLMGLGMISLMFLSMNIPAVADMNLVPGDISMGAAVDLAKDSQSLQAVARTDNRANEITGSVETTLDLRAFVQAHIDQMDKEYWHFVIAQVNSYVNVRALPSEDGEVVGKLYNNSVGEYISEENGWYYITSGNVTGYVKAEYCVIGEAASKRAKEMLAEGKDFVSAESKEEEAARLAEEKRKKAESAAKQKETATKAIVTSEIAENGLAVASYACQFIGNPYKWGGTSLTEGADCSGFVMSVYANFGVELPHSSSALRKVGYDVGSLSDAIAGDIICYSGHVGIYIGDGRIVHASTKKTGIIVSNADYKTILKIRRIF